MNEKNKKRLFIAAGVALLLGIAKMATKFKILAPVVGIITSKFGTRKNPNTGKVESHNGIDIRASVGTPVKAPAGGSVFNVYRNEAGGLQMILLHKEGYKTGYAHLDKALVSKGDKVTKGQLVAHTGKSGRVTAAHLHFTVTDPKGVKVDPLKYIT